LDVPQGRDGTSCRDDGNAPETPGCPQFSPRDDTARLADNVERVAALTQQSYQEIFHEILAEKFVLEQDMAVATTTIEAQLQVQGANVRVDLDGVRRTAGWLIDMYATYRMTAAVGLSRFTDEIMRCEIERYFGK
jgi:hypothetical protein